MIDALAPWRSTPDEPLTIRLSGDLLTKEKVLTLHPLYPDRPGHPQNARCVCGGILFFHGAKDGCDDCDCEAFTPTTPKDAA